MRLCLYEAAGDRGPELGMATEAGIIAAGAALPGLDGGAALKAAIARFDELRPELERLANSAEAVPLGHVRLLPPLARPAKIACCTRMQGTDRKSDLYFFLKAAGSAQGSGGKVKLPLLEAADLFTHNVHVAVVIGAHTHALEPARWREAVFGYTAMVDVTARNANMARWKDGRSPLGSSCDTFTPLGPWIVPRSDVGESGGLHISLHCGGELRQEDRLERLDEEIGEAIELASTVMTLGVGDVIGIAGSLRGQGPIQDGDPIEVDFDQVGRLAVTVSDPERRSWDRTLRIEPGNERSDTSALVRSAQAKG
jgi:2-keto-4-pentenoate hydratase/2-oxohepta-3-ene-1,7-dioic acid hydratase in catechol pathway